MNTKPKFVSRLVLVAGIVILPVFIAIVSGCVSERPCSLASSGKDALFQHALINSLMQGQYDGTMPVAEMLKHGDFGLGTFDKLDGEMVVLDGKCYQVRSDGSVRQAPAGITTPFCAVTPFKEDIGITVKKPTELKALQALIDSKLPGKNLFYAIKITGTFSGIKTRSVPRQEPPYPPLALVIAGQALFDLPPGQGTIVGFRCPDYAKMLNVPGYHFHYLNHDRTAGGHLMAGVLEAGRVDIDVTHELDLSLPADSAVFQGADLTTTTPKELEKVESGK